MTVLGDTSKAPAKPRTVKPRTVISWSSWLPVIVGGVGPDNTVSGPPSCLRSLLLGDLGPVSQAEFFRDSGIFLIYLSRMHNWKTAKPGVDIDPKFVAKLDEKAAAIGGKVQRYFQIPMTPAGNAKDAPVSCVVFVGDLGQGVGVSIALVDGIGIVEPKAFVPARH